MFIIKTVTVLIYFVTFFCAGNGIDVTQAPQPLQWYSYVNSNNYPIPNCLGVSGANLYVGLCTYNSPQQLVTIPSATGVTAIQLVAMKSSLDRSHFYIPQRQDNCLQAQGGESSPVYVNACSNQNPNQQWVLEDSEIEGIFRIQLSEPISATPRCLQMFSNAASNGPTTGQLVECASIEDSPTQYWGNYAKDLPHLKNVQKGTCLSISNASATPDLMIPISTNLVVCDKSDMTQIVAPQLYYNQQLGQVITIFFQMGFYSLTSFNQNSTSGIDVPLGSLHNSYQQSQLWNFNIAVNGSYSLNNVGNHLCASAQEGSSNMVQTTCNEMDPLQQWMLV